MGDIVKGGIQKLFGRDFLLQKKTDTREPDKGIIKPTSDSIPPSTEESPVVLETLSVDITQRSDDDSILAQTTEHKSPRALRTLKPIAGVLKDINRFIDDPDWEAVFLDAREMGVFKRIFIENIDLGNLDELEGELYKKAINKFRVFFFLKNNPDFLKQTNLLSDQEKMLLTERFLQGRVSSELWQEGIDIPSVLNKACEVVLLQIK